jgi:hypothetical protein
MNFAGSLFCAALLVASGAAFAEPRTFTDSASGRTLTAEVLSATASDVTLKLASGATHTLPLSRLSATDQAHVSQWLKSNPAAAQPTSPAAAGTPIRYSFNVTWQKEKTGEKVANMGVYKGEQEDWTCKFTITNLSSVPLDDIEVRYQVHTSVERMGRTSTDERLDGSDKIPSMPRNQPVQVSAKPVALLKMKLESGYITTDGSRGNKRDSLKGVAVGIFHKGVQLHEFRSPGVPKTPFGEAKGAGQPR